MKKHISLILLGLVTFFGSCSSDSETVTNEEKEYRALMNNEWELIAERTIVYEEAVVSIHLELLEECFNAQLYPIDQMTHYRLGMSKKGGFYSWTTYDGASSFTNFCYACMSQVGNKFTGYVNGIEANDELTDMYIRKVDEHTIKLLLVTEQDLGFSKIAIVKCMLLNKIGNWDEDFSVVKIFEMFNYSAEDIESWDLKNYERDKAQGRCQ